MSESDYYVTVASLAPRPATASHRRQTERFVGAGVLIAVTAVVAAVGWVVVSTVIRVLSALAEAPPLLSI